MASLNLRHPKVQIIIMSIIIFCTPGMFNALNSLGPPGLSAEHLKYNQNTALYACFAVFALLGGGLNNILGPRLMLALGGSTYAIYAGSYVAISRQGDAAGSFAIAAGALLGVGAGILWAAQGAMIMSYPTEEKKGSYFALFWSIFNLGAVIGSLAAMGINWSGDGKGPSEATYIAFLVIMAVGVLAAAFIMPPSTITREDGTPVTIEAAPPVLTEALEILKLFTDPRMLLMFIPAAASNWFYTYQFGPYQAVYTTRTQGLNNVFYWGAQMLGSYIIGDLFLDNPRLGRVRRAWVGLGLVLVSTIVIFGGGLVWEYTYGKDKIDVVHNSGKWFTGFLLYVFYGLYDAIFQTYAYWIMGALTNNPLRLSRYAGFFKGVQSAFGAVSWQLGTVLKPETQSAAWLWITLAPCLVSCVLFAAIVKWFVGETSRGEDGEAVEPVEFNVGKQLDVEETKA